MPIQTMVAVLLRGADGTVDQQGTATLLTPTQLVVHPPFSDRFAADTPDAGDLSVCIATWATDPPTSERIAVARIGVAARPLTSGDGQELTVVALELVSEAAAPRLVIDHTGEAVAAHLADPFNGAAVVLTPHIGPHQPNVICALTGMFC